jgi:hypothetical protein
MPSLFPSTVLDRARRYYMVQPKVVISTVVVVGLVLLLFLIFSPSVILFAFQDSVSLLSYSHKKSSGVDFQMNDVLLKD